MQVAFKAGKNKLLSGKEIGYSALYATLKVCHRGNFVNLQVTSRTVWNAAVQ